MTELKMGNKDALRKASKKSESILNQPVSKRISDFLIEERKKEQSLPENQRKKIARPINEGDVEI